MTPKRPRDISQAAKLVIDVATGQGRGPASHARGTGQRPGSGCARPEGRRGAG
jgi:hypothetical protein